MIDIEQELKDSASHIETPALSGEQLLHNIKTSTVTTPSAKKKIRLPFLQSGVAGGIAGGVAATFILSAIAPVALAETTIFFHGIDRVINNLSGAYVDMEGVTAFGIWNAPEEKSATPTLTNITYIEAKAEEIDHENQPSEDMVFDEELYEWESDYDWDPNKANVLVALDEDGNMKEVVYERANARGQIRQDVLGNAAMVYSSESFTYVMYVSDSEWEFWKDINYAQESVINNGFHCHHESMQTIVIHNATGKVFALKDLIAQVDENSGVKNYTMQANPTYDDHIWLYSMYGNAAVNHIQQWYSVVYDEEKENIRYDFVHYEEDGILPEDYKRQGVSMVKRDKYGQEYILAKNVSLAGENFKTNGNTLVFMQSNLIYTGTDGCMYTMIDGKLQVFGENFTLSPVDSSATASMKGMIENYFTINEGDVYHLEDGYLYSMSGAVWKIAEDGTMNMQGELDGSFPALGSDCYIIGNEIIAFVDGRVYGRHSCDGVLVKLTFGLENGEPSVKTEKIMKASEIRVQNQRMIVLQDKLPSHSERRGPTKYFLIQVNDGKVSIEYIAYGDNGCIEGLVNPITEPLKLQ